MIIACIGFILFIGLLLFHRMHRNYLTGTVSNGRPHTPLSKVCFHSFHNHHPLSPSCIPKRDDEKVGHGGGTGAERISKNRAERGGCEQLRRDQTLQQPVIKDLKCFTWGFSWTSCRYSCSVLEMTWYMQSKYSATVRGYSSDSFVWLCVDVFYMAAKFLSARIMIIITVRESFVFCFCFNCSC